MNSCTCGGAADLDGTTCRRCAALHDLGLSQTPTDLEIREAHRLHVKAWHPDRFPGDARDKLAAQEKLKTINAAHQFLTSPAGQKSLPAPSGEGAPAKAVSLGQAIRELSWWRYALFLAPVLAWAVFELTTSNSRASRRGKFDFGHSAASGQPSAVEESNVSAPGESSRIGIALQEQEAEQSYRLKNYRQARSEFQTACNAGQMKGCNYLGYLYAEGLGGRRNRQVAREIYQTACNQRLLSSCASLGSLYRDAGNREYARTYYKTACSGGLTEACGLLKSTP